jgi:type IV pilus assembly protein PilY1
MHRYVEGFRDGAIITRPHPTENDLTISKPTRERNDSLYTSPRHKAAYNRGYDDASNNQPSNENEYIYYYYETYGSRISSPINLSSNFRAYFDRGARMYLISRRSGSREIEHRTLLFSDPTPAFYTRYKHGTPPRMGHCYPDSDYDKVVITSESERRNFANWFSYHRTRILVMQTAMSIAFNTLNENQRVGFAALNNNRDYFLPIDNFRKCEVSGRCQKSLWYDKLFSIMPANATPLMDAAIRAGKYFEEGRMPGVGGSHGDPVLSSCQRNFHILSTDGYASHMPLSSVGNTDQTVPALPVAQSFDLSTKTIKNGVFDPIAGKMLTPGAQFPPPFYENAAASGNFLSDVAMHYWVRDLKPYLPNNVPPTTLNPATWQHLSLYTIGFGLEGHLAVTKANYDALVSGALKWPSLQLEEPTMLDDMWHAALNGHGRHLTATDAGALRQALEEYLSDSIAFSVGSAAAAVSNPDLTATDNTAFVSGFDSGIWSGSLHAHPIDLNTGMIDRNQTKWRAETILNARNWTSRLVASYSGSAGVPFSTQGLTAQQLTRLNTPGLNDSPDVISFLRGDTSKEGSPYRRRGSPLGDIVNASPLYIGPPSAQYGDAGYQSFKSAQANRTKMVYQGANDGMLHAFNANTGIEQWAYVPGRLIAQNHVTPIKTFPSTSTLVNLSFREGFSHRYYVDGTPVSADVDLNNTRGMPNRGTSTATPKWATLLVGGLNKGGRGYFALDITSPAAANDNDVARKVKWEFPRDDTNQAIAQNVGFSFGKPVIVKTDAAGWVVLVTSGHNNGQDTGGDGRGYLFVLDAHTGNIIKTLSTDAGNAAAPSGLAHISAYVEFGNQDRTVQYVYGGDLVGNVWRFDLTGSHVSGWNVKKLATLTDAAGNPQPITTAPELTKFGDKRLVLVGTGQYLGLSDVPGNTFSNPHASQTQSFYVLTDDRSPNPLISSPRSQLQRQTITINGATASISSNAVDLSTTRGWYADLPHAAERSITHPIVVRGVVAFTTNIPGSDTCQLGGSSWLYVLNVKDGSKRNEVAGTFLGNTLASEVVPVRRQGTGAIQGIIRKSDGETATERLTDRPARALQRKMWREIIRE